MLNKVLMLNRWVSPMLNRKANMAQNEQGFVAGVELVFRLPGTAVE
jgi:hypothetical protein